MCKVLRATMPSSSVLALALVAGLLMAAPAAAEEPIPAPLEVGELQLVALDQSVPLVSVLDNPCTAAVEAIKFEGAVHLVQEVRQTASGNLRLIVWERTSLQGSDTLLLGGGGPAYAVDGASEADVEMPADSLSLLSYKKVQGTADNFHIVLVLDFDPSTLNLELKLEGACDNGLPPL